MPFGVGSTAAPTGSVVIVPPPQREHRREFHQRYERGPSPALVELERRVLGSDFGSTGWTSVDEATELAELLRLRPGQRLLDLGSGRGWPGLFLAGATGCDVVLVDEPVEGLRHGAERASQDGIRDQVAAVAATGAELPFRPASFDAVTHTDVLCWLRPKLSVLRATRRLLRPGGRTAFGVIHLADGLSPSERRRGVEAGPVAVATRSPSYADLVVSAGFSDVAAIDVTPRYGELLRRWVRHALDHEQELAAAEPGIVERMEERMATRAAVDAGILRRSLIVGERARR